ncbi:MAG: asparaginase [Chloroflexi bacterium]|nr:MAG: asparaginase [Chloroflexota bacterium]
MSTPRLKLLATGGTIATVRDPVTGQTRAAQSGEELLAGLRTLPGEALPEPLDVDVQDLSLLASWRLTPHDMQRIALEARAAAVSGEYAGVVVTHGTQTLEYTAFLTDLFVDADTPVVFTGAMRPADVSDGDGPANLQHALRVALAADSRGRGTLVAFAGKLLSARDAWKWNRSAPEAFVSMGGNPASQRVRRVFKGEIEPRVGMVKAYPGSGGEALMAILASGVRGMVIEGLPGQGGVPEGMHEAVAKATALVPVVLSSRAPAGRLAADPTGGTGEPLRGLGMISAGGLTTEKAWLLLMVVLAEARTTAEVKVIFDAIASPEEEI